MENAREDAGISEGMGEKGGSNSGGLYQEPTAVCLTVPRRK